MTSDLLNNVIFNLVAEYFIPAALDEIFLRFYRFFFPIDFGDPASQAGT
tara:strand:+ start:602 stop:748 length:147 start_codon:yes stop_codon:yes gene_type:complete